MDIGDVTDPNMDGDFQALLEARQKRTKRVKDEAVIRELISAEDAPSFEGIDEILLSTDSAPQTAKVDAVEAGKLQTALFETVMRDDATECQKLAQRVASLGLAFTDTELRRGDDDSTVLHCALEKERWSAARYLIASGSEKFLTDGYKIVVRKVSSRKCCLHILTEKGNYELTKLLLERLTIDSAKKELTKTVLTELEGQRPRELNCMHLAALTGHTNLIELFHELGVDVNITNNKNDTPVLWAARGNHIGAVRTLIQMGANLELENDKGSTPLYWAVRYGFAELVEILAGEGKANVRQERKLGLVSPIVLASALGYHDIVDILLTNGADANVKINNDQTALHVAAAEGNDDVIQVLMKRGDVDINHADCNGNTAMLFAAKAGNISTMKILVQNGANIDCKNKMGQNIWDHVMHQPDKEFLRAIAHLYRRAKRSNDRKLNFVVGKTPLHAAASNGDVEKMRCLLEIGADPRARDLNGNTFFHVAARDDRMEVIQAFLSEVDVNDANNDGDTALHLACKSGHIGTTQVLLQKAKLDARNKLGMTPLHEAVGSDSTSPELIRTLVDMVVKESNWSLVDAVDRNGNTALHIAARRGKPEILPELGSLNPKIANHEGDSPFHVAARSGIALNLDTMIAVFNKPEKGVNIDQRNKTGEGCLHVCARRGDLHSVSVLVSCGADLALQNNHGNTVIHAVIEESVEEPAKKEALLEVFRGITLVSARWWCMKNDHQHPNEESEAYYSLLRISMVSLTSKVYNNRNLNAVAYASRIGAVDMLEEILNTANVYRFREIGDYVFDITNLVPQTTPRARKLSPKKFNKKKSSVGVEYNDDEVQKLRTDDDAQRLNTQSCLDYIVSLEDEVLASKILDVHPFRQLVRNYWNAYQWFYLVLMLIHIVYMSLFTVYVAPASDDLYQRYYSSAPSACHSGGKYELYGLFLIWPGILLVYEIYSICSVIVRTACRPIVSGRRTEGKDTLDSGGSPRGSGITILSLPYQIISLLFYHLGHLTALAFCALVIAWYTIYRCPSNMSTYVQIVSMVFVLGWLFTISFTKGFEGMHSYSIMLKYIIIRDITRYLFMYIFFLLGCGLAFNALFQIVPVSGCTESAYFHNSIWYTLFNVFNLMLGLGSLFDDSFDDCYTRYGGNPAFVRCLYIFYIIIATVILISLLVAMMTDTYTDIKAKEGTTWKVGSLRLALQIERSLPCIKRFLRGTGIVRDRISFDSEAGRWVMAISADQIGPAKALETDELLRTVQRLENKMDHLQGAYAELSRMMESTRSVGAGISNLQMTKRTPTWFSVLNQVRERPFTAKGGRRKEK